MDNEPAQQSELRISKRSIAALVLPVLMWSLGFCLIVHLIFYTPSIYPCTLSLSLFELALAYLLIFSCGPVGILLSAGALRSIRKNADSLSGSRYAIEAFFISVILLLLTIFFMVYFFSALPDFHMF